MGADQLWRRSWYPVAFSKDLEPDRPTAFTLLGDDLVLWFDRQASPEAPAGQWRAFADVCPHRLVPLSQGRLNDRGELECPYHGWSFNGQGHCTAIPQADPGISLDTPAAAAAPTPPPLARGCCSSSPAIPPRPPAFHCRCCPGLRRTRAAGPFRTPSAISPTTP
ncbi:Rieske 2Fe-2S domain-containing protein [Cyanobium sp. ATX-6F1]|uniref:Rieske 2Fe-2S domain-containing protein n=1 Tax=Cyanobium sp. ATX-6F1 TaxID=3137388 RepID=UPI0039BE9823